jgi:hypothetical protein
MFTGGKPALVDIELDTDKATPCDDDHVEHRGQGSNTPDNRQEPFAIGR